MSTNIGARVRDVRKRRGMSQRELSGVSLSLIRKLEQGERGDTRLETARQLAAALHVPTTHLMTDSNEETASQETVDQWEPVRRALVTPASADDLEEPTLQGVRSALRDAMPLFSGDHFAELGATLPPLLRDAEVLARHDPDGRAVRVKLMQLTGWLLAQTRHSMPPSWRSNAPSTSPQTAFRAPRRSTPSAGTPAPWTARRGPRTGHRVGRRDRAAHVQGHSGRVECLGWLLLRVSAASVRDNRPGEAEDALPFARSAAVAMGREFAPREDFLRAFGPVTVALKRTENAMIVGQPDKVLQLASRIPADKLKPTSNNRNRHLLDVADAQARTRHYAEAVEVLQGINESSPQWLPNQRYARDILDRVVKKCRTLTPEMRTLADAVGLPM